MDPFCPSVLQVMVLPASLYHVLRGLTMTFHPFPKLCISSTPTRPPIFSRRPQPKAMWKGVANYTQTNVVITGAR